jgi:twinkle protein
MFRAFGVISIMNFRDYNITGLDIEGPDEQRTLCPQCSHERRKKTEKCLAVNIIEKTWFCHHCAWGGSLGSAQYKGGQNKQAMTHIERPQNNLNAEWVQWFQSRGISRDILERNRVGMELRKGIEYVSFNYFVGELCVNAKMRTMDKQFTQTPGGFRTLYKLNDLQGATYCIICEGEIDALSFEAAGVINAVSVPDGAINPDALRVDGKMAFLENCVDALDAMETIFLACDADGPGLRLTDELARRLGRERCKVVKYPEGCKDANDVLVKYGAQTLFNCIATAEPFPLDGVVNISDAIAKLEEIKITGFPDGAVTHTFLQFDDIFKFFPGQLTIVTGIPSHGKSGFIDNVLVTLARNHSWKHAVFSPENPQYEMWVIRLLEIAKQKPFFGAEGLTLDEIRPAVTALAQYFYLIQPSEQYTLEVVMATAKQLLRRFGINTLVIDPWNNLEVQLQRGESEVSYTARVLVKLRMFARQTGIHVILIAHPRKMAKDMNGFYEVPTAYDISGSAHFYNVADNILSVYREMPRDGVDPRELKSSVYVQKVKTKYTGAIGSVDFTFDKNTQTYHEYYGAEPYGF